MDASTAQPRDTILDAAEPLFARQGYAATTIKQISGAAGVNSALLYYYFADKEALYREVLARLISGLAAEGQRRLRGALDPSAAIRALVEGQVEMLLARPHLPQLLVRELVDHQALHAQGIITEHMAGLFSAVCDLIRAGQRSGQFRPDLEPRYAAVSTISQVVYFFIARPAMGLLMGGGPAAPPDETMRDFGRHAAGFTLAALARHPAADRHSDTETP
jgi:TetR/AcrR family transcriptional regulator